MPAIWIPKRLVDINLINIAAANTMPFVAHCEAEYEGRVGAAAAEILGKGYRIVMLSGPSASGKTTTANKLAAAIRKFGKKAQVVSLDDFYHNIDLYPLKENGEKDYESVDSLNLALIEDTLKGILKTGAAPMPLFDFKEERRKDGAYNLELAGGVLVVEGIHALNPALTDALPENACCFVYAGLREEYALYGQRALPTRDLRLVRRMVRDEAQRGHSLEKTIEMWGEVCQGEDKYIKVYKPNADILLDTSFSYEICCFDPVIEKISQLFSGTAAAAAKMKEISEVFAKCHFIEEGFIPQNSMLREFIHENS